MAAPPSKKRKALAMAGGRKHQESRLERQLPISARSKLCLTPGEPAAFYLLSTEMISTATSSIQNRQLQGRFGKRALGRRPELLKFNFGETRVPARKGGARAAALECGVAFSVEDKSCQALNFYAALHGLSARPGSNYRFQI
jgi:hypothetical protein